MPLKPEILVVDDSLEICTTLNSILEDLDIPSRYFDSSIHALNYFESEKNPIVILDIYIPDMDGIELLTKIKSIQPDTVVIMITGERDIQIAISAIKQGASDFLLKPFTAVTVKQSIDRALEYYNFLRHKEIYRETIESDLKFTAKLQKKILFPSFSDSKHESKILSKTKTSNTFFHRIEISSTKEAIILGEVEGTDLSSSFVALTMKTFFMEALLKTQSPSEIMYYLNMALFEKLNTHSSNCIVLWIDTELSEIRFSYSGMPLPLIVHGEHIAELKNTHSDILGILPNIKFEEQVVPFQSQDLLILWNKSFSNVQNSTEGSFTKILKTISGFEDPNERFTHIKIFLKEYTENKKIDRDLAWYIQLL